jgi:hypothetical protein
MMVVAIRMSTPLGNIVNLAMKRIFSVKAPFFCIIIRSYVGKVVKDVLVLLLAQGLVMAVRFAHLIISGQGRWVMIVILPCHFVVFLSATSSAMAFVFQILMVFILV